MLTPFRRFSAQPDPSTLTGLYDGQFEHDACGVAFVATLRGEAGHDIVELALTALRNLEHRGAVGAEVDTGDGAGILTQVPDAFLRDEVVVRRCPTAGAYAVGTAFLPDDDEAEAAAMARIEGLATEENLVVLGWREVPVTQGLVGADRAVLPAAVPPAVRRLGARPGGRHRRWSGWRSACASGPSARPHVYFPSLSARTLVYKGMLTTGQLEPFFPDLSDRRYATELAIVHSRFSTNTFPSWPLAHPFRMIAHNGEINTVKGNRNWMQARESMLASRGHPRGPVPAVPDLHPRAPATRPASTRCSSCCTWAGARCRTPS